MICREGSPGARLSARVSFHLSRSLFRHNWLIWGNKKHTITNSSEAVSNRLSACFLVGMSRGMWRRYNRRRTDRCDVRASPIGPHGRREEVGSAWPSSQPGLCPQQLARRASDREKVTVKMWKTRKQTEKRFWKAWFTKLGNNCTQFGKLVTKKLYMHLHLLRKVHNWLGLILKTDLFAGHFVPWMWGNSEMYLDKIMDKKLIKACEIPEQQPGASPRSCGPETHAFI